MLDTLVSSGQGTARSRSAARPSKTPGVNRWSTKPKGPTFVGSVDLTEAEVKALTLRPRYDVVGNLIKVDFLRNGAPRGFAHMPVARETWVDRDGRTYHRIVTELVDLKAEVYRRKREARATKRVA